MSNQLQTWPQSDQIQWQPNQISVPIFNPIRKPLASLHTFFFHLFHESPSAVRNFGFSVCGLSDLENGPGVTVLLAAAAVSSQQIVFVGFRLNVTRSLENKTCCTFG